MIILFIKDKVNLRIAVTILFPEPICVRVSITFKGRRIPNGEFDVIVLSSSDTTLGKMTIKKNIKIESVVNFTIFQCTKISPNETFVTKPNC